MEEAARADHAHSIAAARRAREVHLDVSPLKRVVPAAAAIAVATATAAGTKLPEKADGAPATERATDAQPKNR
jgi:stearoyl-CoA desaturase (delta-9 desaturase)